MDWLLFQSILGDTRLAQRRSSKSGGVSVSFLDNRPSGVFEWG